MRFNSWVRTWTVFFVLGMLGTSVAISQTVVELPTLGGSISRAYDINDLGQIVGFSTHAGDSIAEATIWNEQIAGGLGMVDQTTYSFANAINNNGEVAGYCETGIVPDELSNPRTATFWNGDGIYNIGSALNVKHSMAYDVNDNGIVALQGDELSRPGRTTGYAWSVAMGGIQAGADPIYRFGANYGINNLNTLVGYAAAGFDGAQAIHASFNGQGWDTGIEIGPQAVRAPARANAISENGIVVGQAGDGRNRSNQAALFTLNPRRPVSWLDPKEEWPYSNAQDVNSQELIVGQVTRYGLTGWEHRAVAWTDGRLFDLNHLLSAASNFDVLLSATGVNENRDIVGYGRLHNGDVRAFVIYGFQHGPRSN
jgi:uncharacterized membrane protein